ncbi:MAG: hypothetical protein M1823_000827 [Watsoniomyces obsoletus]|nr:MAG: hypothetical protein M1823_000827 [Watsoniomyces obsoletus]
MRCSITLLVSLAMTALALPNPSMEARSGVSGVTSTQHLHRRAEIGGVHIYTEAELHDPNDDVPSIRRRRLNRRTAAPEPIPQKKSSTTYRENLTPPQRQALEEIAKNWDVTDMIQLPS